MNEPDESADHQLIAEIARLQIAEIAPHELPLFRTTSEAYFRDPSRLQQAPKGGDMLGFGVGSAVTFLTPVVLSVVGDVVVFLATELTKQVKQESSSAISSLIKQLFKHAPGAPDSGKPAAPASDQTRPTLSTQQLDRVYQLARDKALTLQLSEAQAQQLADSLVSSLARTP
jgi:hypothetical protein